MDFERHQNLHTIIMLKDLLRKWWHAELSFADRNGVVPEWQRGEIAPPANAFCRLSLHSREGLRRCSQSVRVLHDKFRASPKLRRALSHECHLGFTLVGAPLYVNNEYEGFVFVEGFLRQPLGERDAELLRSRVAALNEHGSTDLERAQERIPLMDDAEFEKLTDLLEFAVTDICNFEAELSKRDAAVKSLSNELSDR
ncbi:MAG TPA: PocR ligand-binding domain-containing protein, partial [Aggregicoccus sp.]|nr:PocR ligand-binding domain-containing protein [Aggregicoccus sp.]